MHRRGNRDGHAYRVALIARDGHRGFAALDAGNGARGFVHRRNRRVCRGIRIGQIRRIIIVDGFGHLRYQLARSPFLHGQSGDFEHVPKPVLHPGKFDGEIVVSFVAGDAARVIVRRQGEIGRARVAETGVCNIPICARFLIIDERKGSIDALILHISALVERIELQIVLFGVLRECHADALCPLVQIFNHFRAVSNHRVVNAGVTACKHRAVYPQKAVRIKSTCAIIIVILIHAAEARLNARAGAARGQRRPEQRHLRRVSRIQRDADGTGERLVPHIRSLTVNLQFDIEADAVLHLQGLVNHHREAAAFERTGRAEGIPLLRHGKAVGNIIFGVRRRSRNSERGHGKQHYYAQ